VPPPEPDQGAAEPRPIAGVIATMRAMLDQLDQRPGPTHRRVFLATYLRTTQAVAAAVSRGLFDDAAWVERWDAAFAQLYLTALDHDLYGRGRVPRPWRLAFHAAADLPDLVHVLLGINAHVNYDLPQSLLATISDADFGDSGLMDGRRRDHERIDAVLSARVSAEDQELAGPRSVLDRLLTPLNRAASRRFLREARQKVWHNTMELQAARLTGPDEFARRLGELEVLSAAKIADLMRPGQVLLRLAVSGFGVTLPPPDDD
jgi:Family of unknown function (DUF5995)